MGEDNSDSLSREEERGLEASGGGSSTRGLGMKYRRRLLVTTTAEQRWMEMDDRRWEVRGV